ncbi:hypothetical protein [Calothrix sp. NIES-3974]|uniref:hypothetical protein n=1 Tax=Calothrix sp. NIES-3974 TaxID=2005462 RepID=UPI000B5FF58D|nr:hypothetical protein [Calothrix sp. NIES-3974]BAZ06504.1 hypothetical protein NIES3974_31650 [Calothrix sp. NIES-3974]
MNDNFSLNPFANTFAAKISANHEVHAAPLAPLNSRDLIALSELFERNDSDVIEEDINSKLKMMVPEPSWEEDPYEFLREFL